MDCGLESADEEITRGMERSQQWCHGPQELGRQQAHKVCSLAPSRSYADQVMVAMEETTDCVYGVLLMTTTGGLAEHYLWTGLTSIKNNLGYCTPFRSAR